LGVVAEPRTAKNRMHLDIRLRDRTYLNELLEVGATIQSEHENWLVLADPEGNEFFAKHPVQVTPVGHLAGSRSQIRMVATSMLPRQT
jgi:hypothetical protein